MISETTKNKKFPVKIFTWEVCRVGSGGVSSRVVRISVVIYYILVVIYLIFKYLIYYI